MNHETLGRVLTIAALVWLPMPGSAQDYHPVSQQRLLNPEPENWLMFRRTYDGWGYSPLDQINADNVQQLTPVWAFSTGVTEGHQAPPVVNDGVMFITTPGAQVYALDARTGEQLWRYRRQLPFDLMQLHPTNRGVGLHEDKVLVATVDAFVVALNARTGEVEWETSVEDYRNGYYLTLAPLVADGHVMVGVSGGEFGIRGFVTALDADTGEVVWKTYTIPAPGEFGNDTWPGDSWRTGGAPVWVTGTYDPELNLSFWGTGNPGPWIGDVRPGDNLYTNSVLAIDVRTGALRGYHQYHWNGSWDWDEVSPPILMDLQRDGRTVKALVHAGRNGYLWELERTADGIGFVDARAYVTQNVFTAIDPDTGRPAYDPERKPETGRPAYFCPSLSGGKKLAPRRLQPADGLSLHPGERESLQHAGGRGGDLQSRPALRGRRHPAARRRGCGSHRRAAGLGHGHGRAGLDTRVRAQQLGTGARDRRGPGVFGRYTGSLLPGVRCHHGGGAVAAADELRHHGRAVDLFGGRRAVCRRAIRLGRRRTAHAGPHRREPGHHHGGTPGAGSCGSSRSVRIERGAATRDTIEVTETRSQP